MLGFVAFLLFVLIGSILLNVWAVADQRIEDEIHLRIWDETRTLGVMLALAYFVPGCIVLVAYAWAIKAVTREEFVSLTKAAFVAIVKPPHGYDKLI